MKLSDYKMWVKIANLSEKYGNYKLADNVANNLIKLAQNQQFTPGTELQPGQTYEVPTNDNSIFDKVATSGVPDYANVGGEKVLVTHGSSNGMWLISETGASQFFNNNPDFKTSGQLSEADSNAGIQANFESGKNRLWLNPQGMQKYAGSKWVGCYDLNGGKGFGAYGGSKGPIEVVTQTGPDGQKTFVQTPQ
jgi:hypothetical protein